MNKKIAIISAAFMLAVPIIPAFAQVSDLAIKPETGTRGQANPQVRERKLADETGVEDKQARKELAAQKRLEFQDKKEKMAADRCQNIEKKIATRVNRYENNGQMLQKVYGNMTTRLTRLSAQLKNGGADTVKLDADLVTLNQKINKLLADQASFMTTLKSTQTAVCGSTEGEFKTQIENARKVPEVIRQDRIEIKTFFQTTIREDLKAIMIQLGGTLEEGTESETEKVEGVEKQKGFNSPNPALKNETAPTEATVSAPTTTQTVQ